MINPTQWFIKFFWPKSEIKSKELQVHYRVVLYFCFFGSLVMLYSLIKWAKLSHFPLVGTCLFSLVILVGTCFYIKTKPSPIIAANLFIFSTFPHGINMIYSLGGIHSAHIFWLPALVCVAYLLTNRQSGFFWFFLALVTTVIMITLDRDGYEFPHFEFSEAGKKVDTYSGFILPLVFIWLAQSYALRLREAFIIDARKAQARSDQLANKAEANNERLNEMLGETQLAGATLATSTASLVIHLKQMEDNSHIIEHGAELQEKASNDINQTVDHTHTTLSATSRLVQEMESLTQETENNVLSTAQSMNKASQSMEKIESGFRQIEDVIRVIADIVSQTNLLALNATIEAARAGDKGRGFAVVAEEIRSLFLRCDQSAQEIANVIEQSSVDVREGVTQVTNSANVLQHTATSVQHVTQQIHELSTVISQLNIDMNGVASASEKVGTTTSENNKSVQSLLASTRALTTMTDELCDMSDKLQDVINKN